MLRSQNFQEFFDNHADALDLLQQIDPVSESAFIQFCRDRSLSLTGIVSGEPKDFWQRGWLQSEEQDLDGSPRFHPFRIYTLKRIITVFKNGKFLQSIDDATLQSWNQIVDLAILLEPVFWPQISGSFNGPGKPEDRQSYREKIFTFLKTLPEGQWRKLHEQLRIDAAWMDDNDELYLLLRLSKWSQREKLKGSIGGALWFRHIAELIRLGFEEIQTERWLEEDRSFGSWAQGARKNFYGAERPLDNPMCAKAYLARNFELFTGSAVRWYVEGETEEAAFRALLPANAQFGIEIVNLRGAVKSAALRLEDMIASDYEAQRFSLVTIDADKKENVRAIRQQYLKGHFVGAVYMHDPDFEFGNFSLCELIEVAVTLAGDLEGLIRDADWKGISAGKQFEKRFEEICHRSLKGDEWGRALATFSRSHPQNADGSKRPLWESVQAALRGWNSDHDFTRRELATNTQNFDWVAKLLKVAQ